MKKVSNFKNISITLLEVSSFAGSRAEKSWGKISTLFFPTGNLRFFFFCPLFLLSFSQFCVGEVCMCISFNSARDGKEIYPLFPHAASWFFSFLNAIKCLVLCKIGCISEHPTLNNAQVFFGNFLSSMCVCVWKFSVDVAIKNLINLIFERTCCS